MTHVPEAELEILAFLQSRGEATARDVREGIARFRPLAHSSVMTLLGRLEDRGLVTRRKADHGKAFVFRATRKRDAATRPVLRRLLSRVYGGDTVALVASLFETRAPTHDELDELEEMLGEMRKRTK